MVIFQLSTKLHSDNPLWGMEYK